MMSNKVGKVGAFDLGEKSIINSVEKSLNQFSLKNRLRFLHAVHFKCLKNSATSVLIELKIMG